MAARQGSGKPAGGIRPNFPSMQNTQERFGSWVFLLCLLAL
ncbi:hypothetical protein [uncultured Allofournierella sp.]